MNTSNISAGYGIATQDFIQRANQKIANSTTQNNTQGKDSVTLSSHGKQLSKTYPNDDLPPELKSLALPSWLGDYKPEAMDLTVESDLKRWQSEPDVMRREYLAKHSFRTKNSNEISEYQNQLNTYFNEACEKNGIESGIYCYRNLNANPEISEQVHQDVKESLGGDARMLELMDLLEVNL